MEEPRHFNLITITWARGGKSTVALSSVCGPRGGFVDAFGQTHDRTYEIRVSQGALLPNTVDVPSFDVEKTAANMVKLYDRQAGN